MSGNRLVATTQVESLVLLVLAQGIDYGTSFHAGDADKNAQRDHHEIDEEFILRVPSGHGHKSEL
jgi:hypothetical protein